MVDATVCIGCIATSFVCMILVIIMSFSSLQVNEYGLDYSAISKTVNPQPFEAGVHFLGVGHSFLIFPKTVRNIEFSQEHGANAGLIMGRTQDGLQVNLEISFQYRLNVKELFKLFTKFGMKYESVFISQSIDILLEQATKYTASDFFQDRFNIGQQMQTKLDSYFQKEFSSIVEFFQLRKVDLPDKFEASIQETEVQKQQISKAQAQKSKIEVELSTKLMEAEYQATVIKNLAKGDAQSILYEGESRAKAFQQIQDAYGMQYKSIKDDLQFNNDNLVQFMKSKIVREHEGSNIIINLNQIDTNNKLGL